MTRKLTVSGRFFARRPRGTENAGDCGGTVPDADRSDVTVKATAPAAID
jgi:hypothetical protein